MRRLSISDFDFVFWFETTIGVLTAVAFLAPFIISAVLLVGLILRWM